MKALDIYLAVCFFMVFGALLEYATVTYAGKRIKLNMRRFEELEKQIKEVQAQAKSQVRVHSGGEGPQCSQVVMIGLPKFHLTKPRYAYWSHTFCYNIFTECYNNLC